MSDVIIPKLITPKPLKTAQWLFIKRRRGTDSTVKRDPDLNSFVPSGTIVARYDDRMDTPRYYTGDTPN